MDSPNPPLPWDHQLWSLGEQVSDLLYLNTIFAPGFASPVWPALDLPRTPSCCPPKGTAVLGTRSSIPSLVLVQFYHQVLIHVRWNVMPQGKE